jgi:hypothetical protein
MVANGSGRLKSAIVLTMVCVYIYYMYMIERVVGYASEAAVQFDGVQNGVNEKTLKTTR